MDLAVTSLEGRLSPQMEEFYISNNFTPFTTVFCSFIVREGVL